MGDIVDFEKAKDASDKKKEVENNRKKKNAKLTSKYKNADRGSIGNITYFHIGVVIVLTVLYAFNKFF